MGESEPGDVGLTHLDGAGRARMVDVGAKPVTARRAVAEGVLRMSPDTLQAIRDQEIGKGDALTVARLAAVGGAKRTSDLIPLCHPLSLDALEVHIEEVRPDAEGRPGVKLRATACTQARTGVEMEALCAVSAGLLALYDMAKSRDRGMSLESVRLLEKSGGRSGTWQRGSDT